MYYNSYRIFLKIYRREISSHDDFHTIHTVIQLTIPGLSMSYIYFSFGNSLKILLDWREDIGSYTSHLDNNISPISGQVQRIQCSTCGWMQTMNDFYFSLTRKSCHDNIWNKFNWRRLVTSKI